MDEAHWYCPACETVSTWSLGDPPRCIYCSQPVQWLSADEQDDSEPDEDTR